MKRIVGRVQAFKPKTDFQFLIFCSPADPSDEGIGLSGVIWSRAFG